MNIWHRSFLVSIFVLLFSGMGMDSLATSQAQTGDPVLVGAGDIANCTRTQDDATATLLDSILGTVFTLGDNAYPNGTTDQFNNCYAPTWGRHRGRTRPAAGNHDYHTAGASAYYTYFGAAASPLDSNCTSNCKGYYSYNLGTWHIVVLNSTIDSSAGSPQEQWLRADLAANQSVCTLAYWHIPRFSSGQHGNSSTVQAFWQALYDFRADVVLSGHDHTYERFAPQNPSGQADSLGIRQFVVGTGGAELYPFITIQPNSQVRNNTTWGVLKLTLHSTSYDWQFVPIAGQTFSDSGTANCVGSGTTPTATRTPTLGPSPTATRTPTGTTTPSTPTGTTTPVSGFGQLKVCKVAGAGVSQGTLFTIRAGSNEYHVPAGPWPNGYCVLAGEYPLNTEVTIQELIPAGHYVSHIEVKFPQRVVSKDVAQGLVVVRMGKGATEAIFTNRVIGIPTPTRTATPLVTSTPRPSATPFPRGRLQICKLVDAIGATGQFTFRFAGKSVTVPVGACSGLIWVDAGTLTITEDAQAGYAVTDIYTVPTDRLISEDHTARSATVRIVQGYSASQTTVVFRNQTSMLTATPTSTPSMCQPGVVTPALDQIPVANSVEGLGAVDPRLNIDAKGTAIHILEGVTPAVYSSSATGTLLLNAGLVPGGGFSDYTTQSVFQPHQYTFTFAPGVAVSNFSLHMLDFGDYNPTGSTSHLVTMTAYNASNLAVASQQLSYTSAGGISPVYGDLSISGDAISAAPGQPGDWTWNVSGTGIVRIALDFGAGYDPQIGFDGLRFTVDCSSIPPPGPATLISPIGSITDSTPDFIWNKVSDATWYYLWVNGPSGNIIKQWYLASQICGATTCSVTPAATFSSGTHTWWVQTWNDGGYGPWSNGMNFSLPTLPGVATLLSPTGSIPDATPDYTWTVVSEATWYYLWVDGPSGTVIKQWYEASTICGVTTCSVTPSLSLSNGEYIWWIQTWNSVGFGPWSTGMRFSVATNSPPPAAVLVSPSGTISTTAPLYTWNGVSASTWYYLWISRLNPDGTQTTIHNTWYESSAICSGSTCSFYPAVNLPAGNYRWWVQTWNEGGFGPWSSPLDFSIP